MKFDLPPKRAGVNLLLALIVILSIVLLFVIAHTAIDRFIGIFVIAGAIVPLIALNHQLARPPRLLVEYRNPDRSNKPEVWKQVHHYDRIWILQVYLVNDGDADSEAIEVDFDLLNSYPKGQSGGPLDLEHIHVFGPSAKFFSKGRVLAGHDEWFICQLHPKDYDTIWPQANWTARAKGMSRQHGQVRFQEIDPPVN